MFYFLIIFVIIYLLNIKKKEYYDNNKLKKYINDKKLFIKQNGNPIIFILCSVHGNEPSGNKACNNIINNLSYKNGTIIIYANPNPYGLKNNLRFNHNNIDINRSFVNDTKNTNIKKILDLVKISDITIDLHEAIGYNSINNSSKGSLLLPSNTEKSIEICKLMIKQINSKINSEYKKFKIANHIYDPPENSLRYWCNKNNKNYICTEITYEQDIKIKIKQQLLLINCVLDNYYKLT